MLELTPGGARERFFDCGESRDGGGYREVTNSADPGVKAARDRFADILSTMPSPNPRFDAKPPNNETE